jgi:hypothetical protein
VVGVVTRLRAGGQINRNSIPGKDKRFFYFHRVYTGSDATQPPYSLVPPGSFLGGKAADA